MELLAALLALALFSVLSFWQGRGIVSCALWLMTGAMSVVLGLFWFDAYPDYLGITFTAIFIIYMAFCVAHAYLAIARNREQEE